MTFDMTGKSIDDILDYGAPGLEYWEHFLPLYEKAFGPLPDVGLAELQARYDEQRGMNLEKLDSMRKELSETLSGAEQQWSAQQSVAHRLPEIWSGVGGTAALDLVAGQVRRSRDDLDAAQSVVTAIDAIIEPLRQAVLTKAERTIGLLEQNPDGAPKLALGGKSPEDIESLVSEPDDPETHWLQETFKPDVEHKLDDFAKICTATDQFVADQYQSLTTALGLLLDTPYPRPAGPLDPPTESPTPPRHESDSPPTQPSYPQPSPGPESSTTAPAATGATTATGPSSLPAPTTPSAPGTQPGATTSGDAQTGSVTPTGVGTSAGAGTSTGAGTATGPGASTGPGGSTQGVSPQPADRSTPSTSTDESAGSSTGDASLDSLSSSLSGSFTQLLDNLSTGLQTGIEIALGTLQNLTDPDESQDPATEPDQTPGADQPNTPAPTGEKAEFDLAGKHLTLEPGPNGDLKLTITEPTGESHSFTVKLDEHGIPTITADNEPPPETAPDPTSPGDPSQPSPEGDASPTNPDAAQDNPGQSPEASNSPPDCTPSPPPRPEAPQNEAAPPPECPGTSQDEAPAQPDCPATGPEAPGTPPEPGAAPEDSDTPAENPDVPPNSGVSPDDSPPPQTYPGVPPLGHGSLPEPPGATGIPVPPFSPITTPASTP